jgi:hypothetical protein
VNTKHDDRDLAAQRIVAERLAALVDEGERRDRAEVRQVLCGAAHQRRHDDRRITATSRTTSNANSSFRPETGERAHEQAWFHSPDPLRGFAAKCTHNPRTVRSELLGSRSRCGSRMRSLSRIPIAAVLAHLRNLGWSLALGVDAAGRQRGTVGIAGAAGTPAHRRGVADPIADKIFHPAS